MFDIGILVLVGVVQVIGLVLLAPLFTGTSRWLRAKLHTRKGPSVWQDYYDIFKLMNRQDIHTADSSFVSRLMPPLFMGSCLVVAFGMPMISRMSPVPVLADIITIIYLMALPRFFFALAAVDSSSAYSGIGGIRELIIGVLVEPSMMFALFVAALATGTTNVGVMGTVVGAGMAQTPVALIVAGIAFAVACYFELGKLPYDAAEAEQEIQEGPLQEYSGASLAMIKVGMGIKQIVVISWFVAIFLPFGSAADMSLLSLVIGAVVFIAKVAVIGFVASVIENIVARVRWIYISRQTWVVVGIALIAVVFSILGL